MTDTIRRAVVSGSDITGLEVVEGDMARAKFCLPRAMEITDDIAHDPKIAMSPKLKTFRGSTK